MVETRRPKKRVEHPGDVHCDGASRSTRRWNERVSAHASPRKVDHKFANMSVRNSMRLMTFNVCSLRTMLKSDVLRRLVQDFEPQVLALQETKMSDDAVEKLADANILPGYSVYWSHSRTAKGHHGLATLVQKKADLQVDEATNSIGESVGDGEGRVLTLKVHSHDFDKMYIVNTYVPNSGAKLARLEYRVNTWETKMRSYLASLREQTSNVIVLGDLNVAHQEIDIHDSKRNSKNAGHTPEERAAFSELLREGWVDTFRELNPDARDSYTFWSRRFGASTREKNKGWRLDYALVSRELFESGYVLQTTHLTDVQGSDHAPVMMTVSRKDRVDASVEQ